jgi:hypothetical protein
LAGIIQSKEVRDMAKALVFSGTGCPVCKTGYGELALGEVGEHAMKTIQGAAIGAGAVLATDLVLPRILPTVTGTMRSILQGGLIILGSYMLKDKNPELATGIAIGGGAIIAYKVLGSILKVPLAGLGVVMPEEMSGLGRTELEEVSGYGEPDVTYELEGYGEPDVTYELEGYGAEEEIVI